MLIKLRYVFLLLVCIISILVSGCGVPVVNFSPINVKINNDPLMQNHSKFLFWNYSDMANIKNSLAHNNNLDLNVALSELKENANNALTTGPFSVMDKTGIAASGNKHDYYSIGAYLWPSPNTADGLPYINRDGEENPEHKTDKYDASNFLRMIRSVDALSLAYYYTENEQYAAYAVKLIETWFIDKSTRMNPNLNYSSGTPGVSTGNHGGIIQVNDLVSIADDILFLQGSVSWTTTDEQSLDSWIGDFLNWLQNSSFGKAEKSISNNHGTYYYVQTVTYLLITGQNKLAAELLEYPVKQLIDGQIKPDGSQPRELTRPTSYFYTFYNLEGLIKLCIMGDYLGIDLWHYSASGGGSVISAINFVIPYLDGKKWDYPNTGPLDYYNFISYLARADEHLPDMDYHKTIDKLVGGLSKNDRIFLLCEFK